MSHEHTLDRYQQARAITLIGAGTNAFLGAIKWMTGIWFQSHALIADGIHSLSDLLSDGMVIIASRYGSQHADDRHPYGHQRFETAATLMVSVLLILAGLGIISDAGISLFSHDNPKPKIWALPIAALSMLINEILYYYTHQVGKKINSLLLIANAWHHRSDSWASLVVLLGIFGSLLGVYWLDAAAAVAVGLMIANMGRQYALQSIRELVDTAIPETQLSDIKRLILNIDGVVKIHQLRTRSMGNDIYIDVHVMVNPFISVSEGHYIAQNVHHRLMHNHPEIKDVTVHIDPEDDEETTAASEINPLPSRKMLEGTWLNTWQKEFPEITCWNVHYLENAITLDLFLADHFKRWDTLYTKTNHDIAQASHLTNIRYYHIQSKGKLH